MDPIARTALSKVARVLLCCCSLAVATSIAASHAAAQAVYYLDGVGDGSDVPLAALTAAAPTDPTLDNFDPARDAFPGLLIVRGGTGFNESDPTRYQLWKIPAAGLAINGPVSFTIWSAMKNFNTSNGGMLTAYLIECNNAGNARVQIASSSVSRADWDVGNTGTWIQETINFGNVNFTIGAARSLAVLVEVDNTAGDDMWFAYDAVSYPSRLSVSSAGISGTVFEDLNYGGGAGRDSVAAGGVGRPNARVELYSAAGAFITSTTTGATGTYSFGGLLSGTYFVRIVNGSVSSSRAGFVPGTHLPVQTYRTDAPAGAAVPVTDYVGGTNLTTADPGNGGAGSVINTTTYVFTSGPSGTAQTVARLVLGATDAVDVDFGFNFNTIVNANNAGQGSLRQFLTNANGLSNAGLAIVGQAAGTDVSIFMISNGQVHPGQRSGLPNQLDGTGTAVITPSTALPVIVGAQTVVDGRTQTSNIGNTNPVSLGSGGTVGVDGLPLGQVPGPEVSIRDTGALTNGIEINANNVTVRGLAIYGFGDADPDAAILVRNAVTGALIEDNTLGSTSSSFTDPGAGLRNWVGIYSDGGDNGTIRNNLTGFSRSTGVFLANGSSGWTVSGNEVRDNGTESTNADGIDLDASPTNAITGNRVAGTSSQGLVIIAAGATGNTFTNNTVTGNGVGLPAGVTQTPGVVMRSGAATTTLDRNVISANYGAGIQVNSGSTGTVLTRNSFVGNGTIVARNGAGATGQIGIDLNSAGDNGDLGTAPFFSLNDAGDGDTGGNGRLNFPVLTTASVVGGNLVMSGFARPGSAIEFFMGGGDPSGFGEGQTYLFTATEGSGADVNAGTGTYGPGPVNGLTQGTDTTNRFTFAVPLPGGVVAGTLITATATVAGETSEFSGVVQAVNVTPVTVAPTSGLITTEAGSPDTFTVVLNLQPTANVTIGLTSSDLTEGTVAPASLTFTNGNWNVAQNVIATGVDDLLDDGDILYTIVTAAATSTDPIHNGFNAPDVSVTNADDDTAGIVVNPTSGLVTTEAGGPAGFTVVLATQPTADVTIGLTSSDLTEGTVAPASVTFNTGNWNVPVNVTVTGVDDPIDDGDILYTIVTVAATSTDPVYSGVNASDVSVTNTDDDSGGIVVNPTSGLVTTEAGGPAGFTVVLATQPTADVTIGLTSSDLTEGTVAPPSVTFNTGNWNVPVNVTLTGVDDPIDDGDILYTIVTAAATSTDPVYAGVNPSDVSVTNTDDDSGGIIVNPTSGLVTTEAGGPAGFTVVLATQPTADVTIGLSSSDLTEGTVAPPSVTFNTGNWNMPVNVTVTGVDDPIDDGDIAYTIVTAAATSTDPVYSGVNASDVSVTNTDDDSGGIVVNPTSGLVTTEAGGPAGFTVVLAAQPTADVTIGLTSSDLTEGTVAPPSVTFNTGNWNVPVNVTVTGVDDLIDDGDILYTIVTAAATSTDPVYSGVNASDVSVTNTDDDSGGIVVNPTSGLVTTEGGGPAGFTVVLATQPTADVTIGLSSSDLTEGTVAPPSVTFNTGNWNVPVNVTVTGVDDPIDDGDIAYTIVTAAATSTDPVYSGVNPSDVSVTNTDDDSAGIVVNPTSGLITTEAGGPAGFTVVLATQPTANVTIGLTSSDLTEGTVAPSSVTFNTGNWNVPVNVTATGVDDILADGNIAYSIVTAPASSTDPVYSGVNPSDVSVTNTDDDTAGIVVNPTSGLVTTEAGGPAGFTVVLATQPTADVTIGLSSSDLTEGTVAPASVTFNTANWNVPVNVTVTGVDDPIDDGDILYTIVTAAATSTDPTYSGVNPSDVSVTNTDDDSAGIVVNPTSGLITTEAGGPAGFTVVLATQPTADVTIGLTSSDLTEGTVAPASVTFNTGNWSVPQNVTVTGVDDILADGNIAYSIVTAAASSADPVYNGVNPSDVGVTNTDDDASGVTVTPTSGLITTEAGGGASFTIVLNTQPTADVTIGLTSNDLTEGTVAPASVTFTTVNWSVPRNVNLTGVDDIVVDGNVAYSIVTAAASSADPAYNGVDPSDVSATNTDNDLAGVTVNPTSGLTTTEAGGPATFAIVLNTQPTADVTIGLTSNDLTEGAVAPASVTFTTGNWNAARTITVTGVDDAIIDGTIGYSIVTGAASSADPAYNGLAVADVSVANLDNDGAQMVQLELIADEERVEVGEPVGVALHVRSLVTSSIAALDIIRELPAGIVVLPGTATRDGSPIVDPGGAIVSIGPLAALVDSNGNGRADPGEPGYALVRWRAVVGAGAYPGSKTVAATAASGCSTCVVSNRAETRVTVEESALLARGTILGRVFEDRDRDGYQDRDEPGLFGAAVALDDGTTVMTDAEGLFHVPEADAGQRLLKLDVARLPYPATPTTDVATVTQVTGGLFTSVRFGVAFDRDTLQIGSPPVRGLALIPDELELGIDVAGNAVRSAVVVNGAKVPIRTADAQLSPEGAGDVLRLAGARLDPPASFDLQVSEPERVLRWALEILSPADSVIRAFEGAGGPPARLEWDGQLSGGAVLRSEEAYAHRLRVHYEDGIQVEGPRRAFGVDQHLSFGLTLTEEAFAPGTASLAPEAKAALSRVAEDIRRAAGDSIFVEGHFDSTGSASESVKRSQERAETVAQYLADQENISRRRITVRALGASRPIASNGTLEGRELNRRVEIFGSKVDVQRSALRDVFRGKPSARVNGQTVAVDSMGRFAVRLPAIGDSLDVAMTDRSGRTAHTKVRLPRLEILEPKGELRLPFGGETQDARVDPRDPRPPEKTEVASLGSLERGRRAARLKLRARTQPGMRATVDGLRVPVAEDGTFEADLPLHLGHNAVGVVLQDSAGMTTVANVVVRALDRTEEGGEVIAIEETPDLTVYLPPGGTVLTTQSLAVTGKTKAGNRVFANGDSIPVGPDGSFAGYVRLPEGHSRIAMDVVDPEGRRGTLERPVEVRSKRMFLVALADGVVGGGGIGPRGETGTWTEGRIAYQLRGWIAGRVLVTSAFDSQRRSWGSLFSDLDDAGRDRLLTNLDPDRLYPVFGDASVASYGAPGGGRFFVALEADAVKASVGDFPIALDEVELAAFHRTLYGAQVQVQPFRLTQGAGSKPRGTDTALKLFGAQAGHVHVRDVLEATGGTLYYLSHRDVIMGSVQVAISVHDRNTGLPLVRQPQVPGLDFIVKEAEGRILFQRPISSVAGDGSLLDAGALGGNPVFIEVDYEAEGTVGEKSALGGRLSQTVGPMQLGGTMIQDETGTSPYTLRGADARLRIGTRSWVGTEFATSDGRAGRVFGSADGGLSFTAFDTASASAGDAWKVATEVDAGEWFGAPGRVTVGGFLKRVGEGFVSDSEPGSVGSRRVGARAQVDAGRWGVWSGRFDRQERFASASLPAPYQADLIGAQWRRDMRRLGVAAEFQDQRTDSVASERRGGVKLWYLLSDSLRASVEHQRSLGGPDVDQSAIGAEWRLPMGLALEGRASDGTEGRGFRGGASLALGGRRFYVREELLRGASGPQGMTVVGVQTPLGRMSRAYSEYQWLRRDGEDHTASVVGVEQAWRVASGFSGSAFGEYGGRGGGGTSVPHTTLALQLGYSGKFPLGVTTRGEFRKMDAGSLDKQFLVATHMDLRLVGGLSLLGDHRLSEALPRGPGESTRYEERSVGMSYRHARSDRVEALARLTDLQDRRAAEPADSLRSTRGLTVGAVEVRMRLWPDLEWAAKGATRVMREGAGDIAPSDAHSTLWVSRVDYAFARPFRIGVQYQQLAQKEAGDRRGGWLQELTWDPDKHLRFGAGYNFTRISGNEFDTTGDDAGGWFVRAQSRY